MKYLPSNKVLSALIITGALVFSIIIAFGKEKSSTAIDFTNNLIAGEKVTIPQNQNWKNELASLDSNFKPTTEKGVEIGTVETDTDKISQSLISNYLSLKQSGNLNQESAQKIVDQTINLIAALGDEVVLETNLNTIPDNGNQSIVNYGEQLGNILKKNKPNSIKNETEIIRQAVSLEDLEKIKELNSIIDIYKKIANDLLKIPVPKNFIKAHLDMANGAKAMAIALEEMKSVFNDPFKGLGAIELHKEGELMFTGAIKATNNFLIKNKISYKQGSGGYFLLYGI